MDETPEDITKIQNKAIEIYNKLKAEGFFEYMENQARAVFGRPVYIEEMALISMGASMLVSWQQGGKEWWEANEKLLNPEGEA